MNAFGHKIEPLIDALKRSAMLPGGGTCSNGLRCPGKLKYYEPNINRFTGKESIFTYTAGAPATHCATYSYVTGRASRVTWRNLYLCDECAEKWRKKNIKQEAVLP